MTLRDRIELLRTEAGQAGDLDQVSLCDRALDGDHVSLVDSDSTEPLSPEDLGVDLASYVASIVESLDCSQPEGHVRVRGHRVYAP